MRFNKYWNNREIIDNYFREDTKLSSNNMTPSAAAVRDFNGTNRSMPNSVSYLLKLSHRGYGSSSGLLN